jgi:ubiquinone/menaquinone biosynthesis C-methylase UbiE
MKATSWQERYVARFYDRSSGWVDGTTEFHALCRSVVPAGAQLLEVGAGPSNRTSRFLATLGELHGLDPDPAVLGNTALSTARVLDALTYPFPDGSFDACISDYVLEHVADPEAHFAEVARVLKPGGVYCFRTPNRYHYVTTVARLTPHWFHVLMANRLRNLPAEQADPYPTFYAANTRRTLERLAGGAGLLTERLVSIEKEPSYGMSSRALFLAFMIYERLVNATELASGLRVNILGVFRKPRADHR